MVVLDYIENMIDGVEYLLAIGSIIGILGFVVGILFFVWGGPRIRYRMLGVIIGSIILLAVCGITTGFTYFRIFG